MFDTVLVANRGEIACRVIRTLTRLGIRSVAVYSDADAGAPHTRLADEAVRIGGAAAADSYLNIEAVIAAATATGAQAVHPGYGFLSENAAFASACAAAGIVFIGPSPEAIAAMGDKIRARQHVAARGVPVVPGLARAGLTDEELLAAMPGIGFPVLIKPSAGGGGKGMHVVERPEEAPAALAAARREAAGAFGDDTLFVERYVSTPRHIEVQVLADTHGAVVALGERECSLQRRHQKVIEEAPSVLLDAATRERIGADACETARSVGYTGAGTVEFIVSADAPGEYFFLEMNTRLQVEHPVTELVTGVDLVEQQLRVAAGEPLPFRQEDVRLTGHAIEARVYAEDPAAGFLPTGGRVLAVALPHGEGVRVDVGIAAGSLVTSDYDPMLAKVIAWAPDRDEAIARLRRALGATVVQGVGTNVAFLAALLDDPDVRAGQLDTGLIGRRLDALTATGGLPDAAVLAALVTAAAERPEAGGVWQRLTGWRLTGRAAARFAFRRVDGGATEPVMVTGSPDAAMVRTADGVTRPAAVQLGDGTARIRVDGIERTVAWARAGDVLHLAADGRAAVLTERVTARGAGASGAADPELRSPMPGTVVAIPAAAGTTVAAGDPVVVVEAMKMEYAVRATTPGRVLIDVAVGDRVTRGQVLAVVEAIEEAAG